MKDNTLLEKIKHGDEIALEQFYLNHRKEFIGWFVKNYSHREDEAMELYQLTVLIVYDNIATGKLHTLTGTLKSYLFSVGRNKAKEQRRLNARYQDLTEAYYREPGDDYIEVVAAKEEQEKQLNHIERGLIQLGEPCKSLLEYYYYYEMSTQQIMEKLNYKNTDTVKSKKYKCVQRLKKLITPTESQMIGR